MIEIAGGILLAILILALLPILLIWVAILVFAIWEGIQGMSRGVQETSDAEQ